MLSSNRHRWWLAHEGVKLWLKTFPVFNRFCRNSITLNFYLEYFWNNSLNDCIVQEYRGLDRSSLNIYDCSKWKLASLYALSGLREGGLWEIQDGKLKILCKKQFYKKESCKRYEYNKECNNQWPRARAQINYSSWSVDCKVLNLYEGPSQIRFHLVYVIATYENVGVKRCEWRWRLRFSQIPQIPFISTDIYPAGTLCVKILF